MARPSMCAHGLFEVREQHKVMPARHVPMFMFMFECSVALTRLYSSCLGSSDASDLLKELRRIQHKHGCLMLVLGSRASSDNISAAEQIMLQCRAFFTIAENNFGS